MVVAALIGMLGVAWSKPPPAWTEGAALPGYPEATHLCRVGLGPSHDEASAAADRELARAISSSVASEVQTVVRREGEVVDRGLLAVTTVKASFDRADLFVAVEETKSRGTTYVAKCLARDAGAEAALGGDGATTLARWWTRLREADAARERGDSVAFAASASAAMRLWGAMANDLVTAAALHPEGEARRAWSASIALAREVEVWLAEQRVVVTVRAQAPYDASVASAVRARLESAFVPVGVSGAASCGASGWQLEATVAGAGRWTLAGYMVRPSLGVSMRPCGAPPGAAAVDLVPDTFVPSPDTRSEEHAIVRSQDALLALDLDAIVLAWLATVWPTAAP